MFMSRFLFSQEELVFFFKQKTAYEWRIRDWSSDVCSSDLTGKEGRDPPNPESPIPNPGWPSGQLGEKLLDPLQHRRQLRRRAGVADAQAARFAEGRARHAGHALGFEQRVAQFDIVADELAVVRLAEGDADVRERVER